MTKWTEGAITVGLIDHDYNRGCKCFQMHLEINKPVMELCTKN